ncbi:hypothetical protein CERZMDRAFT_81919 [Cercospora zeae-maydis SCOH1-5]|uniref:Uncharacterized protein n=1 Tax=Cercospora zeae-maydis SCOH1-5 TaxID=717836 RepID=A0A6A6FQR5_9PEZI|nr:hypothetical protein CERZMDRAFT_81919 [Cercospora zeae-maydis SCOH1-5]
MCSQGRTALANLHISTSSLPLPKSPASPSAAGSLWRRRHASLWNTSEAPRETYPTASSDYVVSSSVTPPTRGTFLSAIDEANTGPQTAFATVEDHSRVQIRTHALEALPREEEEHLEKGEAKSRRWTAVSSTEGKRVSTIASQFHHRLGALKTLTRRRSTAPPASLSPTSSSSSTTSTWSPNSASSTASASASASASTSNDSHTVKINDSRFRARSPGGALNSSPLTQLERRANQKGKRQNRKAVMLDGTLHRGPASPLSPLFRPSGLLQPAPLSPVFHPLCVGTVSCMSSGICQAIEQMHETKCKKGEDWMQLGI